MVGIERVLSSYADDVAKYLRNYNKFKILI